MSNFICGLDGTPDLPEPDETSNDGAEKNTTKEESK